MRPEDILPHRFPFLKLDRIIEVTPGKRAVAAKNVTADGYYARGNSLAFPELLLLEAMAQTGALAAAAGVDASPAVSEDMEPGYLASISDARFHGRPFAGDMVIFTLDFQAKLGPLVRFTGKAEVGDKIVAESILTFTIPVRK